MPTINIKCAKCQKPITDFNRELHGANCKGFKPSGKPVNVTDGAKENRGWTVFGTQEHRTIGEGGFGYTQAGYIFDTEEDAQKFYESESK